MRLTFNFHMADVLVNRENIALMQLLNTATSIPQLIGAMPGTFDRTDQIVIRPADGFMPKLVVVWSATDALACIFGANGPPHFHALVASWNQNLNPAQTNIRNLLRNNAQIARSFVSANLNTSDKTWKVLGHSFGGAVAEEWHGVLRADVASNIVQTYAYGPPRLNEPPGFYNSYSPTLLRCCRTDDPVANVPPHTNEAPLLHLAAGVGLSRGMNDAWQAVNGILIDPSGVITVGNVIAGASGDTTIALVDWLAGTNAMGNNNHNLAAYAAAWAAAIPPPLAPIVDVPATQFQQTPRIGGPQARTIIRQAARVEGLLVGANLPAAAARVQARVVPIPKLRYTRFTQYGVRLVRYGDDIVAVCDTKRQQKRMCKVLNENLRQTGM
jgi:hypothetical protein